MLHLKRCTVSPKQQGATLTSPAANFSRSNFTGNGNSSGLIRCHSSSRNIEARWQKKKTQLCSYIGDFKKWPSSRGLHRKKSRRSQRSPSTERRWGAPFSLFTLWARASASSVLLALDANSTVRRPVDLCGGQTPKHWENVVRKAFLL